MRAGGRGLTIGGHVIGPGTGALINLIAFSLHSLRHDQERNFFLLSHCIHYALIKRKNFFSFQRYIRYALATRKRKWFCCTIIFHHYLSSLCKYLLTSHRANICSWNSWTFPWYIPAIFRKRSLWNSGEYSQNNVPGILNIGIFPECSMNILRMLHAFF